MTSVNIQHIQDGLNEYFNAGELPGLIEKMKTGGFKTKLTAALGILELAVTIVEKLAVDLDGVTIGGKEKKQALVTWLDESIQLNFALETIDGPIISMAIDGLVAVRNFIYGNDWLGKFRSFVS